MNLELDSLPRLGLFLLQANLVWSLGFIVVHYLVRQATPKARYSAQLALLAILPLSILFALGLNHPAARTVTDPLTMNIYSGTVLLEALELPNNTNTASSTHGMVRTGLWALSVLGVLGMALLGLGFWRRLSRLFQLAGDTHPEVQNQLDEVAGELGINRPISLFLARLNISPFSYGFGKPKIVLPVELTENLNEDEIDLILRHELHHIRRRDFLINVLQKLIRITFFYNPFVHWLDRLIELDRELLCDQAVLDSSSCTKRQYAELLVQVAEFANQHPMLSPQVTFHSKQSHLRKRLNNMKTNYLSHAAPWRNAMATTALIASFIAVSLTGYGADATKKKTKVKKDKLTFEIGSDQLTIRRNGETHEFSKNSKEYNQLLEQYERLIQQVEQPEKETVQDEAIATRKQSEPISFSSQLITETESATRTLKSADPQVEKKARRNTARDYNYKERPIQQEQQQIQFKQRTKQEQRLRPSSTTRFANSPEQAARKRDPRLANERQLSRSEAERIAAFQSIEKEPRGRRPSQQLGNQRSLQRNEARIQDEHKRALDQMRRELAEQQRLIERQHKELREQLERKHHELKEQFERAENAKQIATEARQKALISDLRARESERVAKKQADRVTRLRQMLEDEGILNAKDDEVSIEFSKDRLRVNGESYRGELLEKARKIFDVNSNEDFKSTFRYRTTR